MIRIIRKNRVIIDCELDVLDLVVGCGFVVWVLFLIWVVL